VEGRALAHQGEDAGDKQIDAHEKFVGKTLKNDFPLFYLLIEQIHEDERIGEFARTGLLYIIESASTSLALEQAPHRPRAAIPPVEQATSMAQYTQPRNPRLALSRLENARSDLRWLKPPVQSGTTAGGTNRYC
jgi:hypothetical protein